MVETTLTRAAARAGSSAAALMPTGKPSEAPRPQSTMPDRDQRQRSPADHEQDPAGRRRPLSPSSVGARPKRSSATGRPGGPRVIAVTNTRVAGDPDPVGARRSRRPGPGPASRWRRPRPGRSRARSAPISRVRGSRQAAADRRARRRVVGGGLDRSRNRRADGSSDRGEASAASTARCHSIGRPTAVTATPTPRAGDGAEAEAGVEAGHHGAARAGVRPRRPRRSWRRPSADARRRRANSPTAASGTEPIRLPRRGHDQPAAAATAPARTR